MKKQFEIKQNANDASLIKHPVTGERVIQRKLWLRTRPKLWIISEAIAAGKGQPRAQIEPFAWIVNQSFLACGSRDPLLLARAANERRYLEEARALSQRLVVVLWQPEELSSPQALEQLFTPMTSTH